MRMFDRVAIAYDQTSMDLGLAVRASLELYRLNLYTSFCVQKRSVVEFLGHNTADAKYIVLCCHGLGSEGARCELPDYRMGFHVVDQVNGKWGPLAFTLTPDNIPEYVNLPNTTVVSLGCGTGREPLAKAFLKAGCAAYVGAVEPVDQNSAVLFANAFFYHLMSEERDPSLKCSEEEACRRAASIDVDYEGGTRLFRYYSRQRRVRLSTRR